MEAIIGVISTILGTILGWVLNSISNRGSLKIFISAWDEHFEHNEVGCMTTSKSKEQTECFHYNLTLDLYNSSGETKIMRNVAVVFSDNKTVVHQSTPKDDYTRRNSGAISFYDDVGPINVPPKTITQLKLHDGSWHTSGGLDYIWNTKTIHLTYMDEKGKTKKVLIKAEDYAHHFDTLE